MSNVSAGPAGPRLKSGRLPMLVTLALSVAVIYFAKPLLVPLVLASLFAFILSPPIVALQRRGVPRAVAVLGVVLIALLAGAAVAYVLGTQLVDLVLDLPTHKAEIQAKLEGLRGVGGGAGVSGIVDMLRDLVASPHATNDVTMVVAAPAGSSFSELGDLLFGVFGELAAAFFVLLLVVFMLLRREDLRNRVIGLLGYSRLTGATRATVDAAGRVSKLLLAQLVVNGVFGALFGVGLSLLGVPYAFLWGFGATLLRFIPYAGILIAAAPPVVLAIAIAPGWGLPLGVLGLVLGLDLVTGSVVEPILFSRKTGVSPLALLVAAAFWTWLWGPIGLLLATPITVCLVVIGQHAPRLRFFAVLLGDEPALAPHATFYQRLLASDEREAQAVAREQRASAGDAATYDDVLLPVLRRVRRDRAREGLDGHDESFVLDAIGRTVESFAPDGEVACRVAVIGCPAHHRSDELALAMLARLCAPVGTCLEVVSSKTLASEIEARVERERPALVVIAVVPPGGLTQALYLCRTLRRRFPELPLVVGYYGATRDYDRLLQRFRKAGASYLTTSVAQSASRLATLLPPPATTSIP